MIRMLFSYYRMDPEASVLSKMVHLKRQELESLRKSVAEVGFAEILLNVRSTSLYNIYEFN